MSITAGSITVSAIVCGFLFCAILYDTWQDTNMAVALTLLLGANFNKFCIKYSSGSFLFVNVLFQDAASVYLASYFRLLRY
jgi:hypothetical protein